MPGAHQKDLYEVIGLKKEASQAEIKKAYHRLALKLHPDKNPGDQDAGEKFQSLQRIYAVLSDPKRREVYDRTGSLEDSEGLAGDQFDNLYDYYRNIYKKVTVEDIEAVEAEYRGSPEEKADVLRYYTEFKGDMEKVFCYVICSEAELDSHRFMDWIDEAIKGDNLKSYKKYKAWTKETAQRKRPANPLSKAKKKRKADKENDESLILAIRSKAAKNMNNLADALQAKYGGGKKSDEPTEEEFEAAAKKLNARKGAKRQVGEEKVGKKKTDKKSK